MSPVSKNQQKSVNKYIQKNYDRINLTLPRGRKAEIQEHAQANGESVNAFIARAIDKTMEEEKNNPQNG
jgi:predicted HicB family RNase H-like nuclease